MRVRSLATLIAVLATALPAAAAPITDFNVFAQKQLVAPRASVTIRFSFRVDAFWPEMLPFNREGRFTYGTLLVSSPTESRYANTPFSLDQYAAGRAWASRRDHTYTFDLLRFTPAAAVAPGVYGLSITNDFGGVRISRDVTWTVQAVPEPPVLSLLVLAGGALVWRRQRRIQH